MFAHKDHIKVVSVLCGRVFLLLFWLILCPQSSHTNSFSFAYKSSWVKVKCYRERRWGRIQVKGTFIWFDQDAEMRQWRVTFVGLNLVDGRIAAHVPDDRKSWILSCLVRMIWSWKQTGDIFNKRFRWNCFKTFCYSHLLENFTFFINFVLWNLPQHTIFYS